MNFKTLLGSSKKTLSKEEIDEIVSAAQIQIERSWWQVVLVVFIFFMVLTLPLIWLITHQALEASSAGKPLPGGWTWPSVIIFDILVLLVSLSLVWIPIKDILTLFTEKGIKQPSWFGLRHHYLKWSEVKYLDGTRSTIRIISPNQTIQLNILLFKRPKEVLDEIRKRIPNNTLNVN